MSSTIYVGGGYRETMVGRSYEPTISRLINGQRITLYRVNDDHKYMSSYDTDMMLEKSKNEYRAKHMREKELGILKQQMEHQDMVRRVNCLILENINSV